MTTHIEDLARGGAVTRHQSRTNTFEDRRHPAGERIESFDAAAFVAYPPPAVACRYFAVPSEITRNKIEGPPVLSLGNANCRRLNDDKSRFKPNSPLEGSRT